MYAWIFRKLPGNLVVRILIAAVLIMAAVFVLMEFIFPSISQNIPWNEPTIGMLSSSVAHSV